MDILKALRELYTEKKRLDVAIAALEARARSERTGSASKRRLGRRGRKSMGAAERLEVSRRMTLYWETRRAQVREAPSPSGDQQASSAAS
jgi:hypothetical protein